MKSLGKLGITLIVLGGLAVCGLAFVIWAYSYANELTHDAVGQETTLSAKFSTNQVDLSDYERTWTEGWATSDSQKEAAKEILKAAFDGTNNAGGEQQQVLVNMIRQANPYPQETTGQQAALINKLYDDVAAHRTTWSNSQKQIRDEARAFENWLNQDLFRRIVLKNFMKIPDNNLKAQINGNIYYGQEALAKMEALVTTGDTQKSYETGTGNGFTHNTTPAAPAPKK
jgi:hypothetical protein